jgi:pyruvate formate lyase activating enzyme
VALVKPRWWKEIRGDGESAAKCELCFRGCLIKHGEFGACGARRYIGGALESPALGRFVSVAVDPIEKKPLYHWRPGTEILSLGSLHCNFFCPFCQNHSITRPDSERHLDEISPRRLLDTAKGLGLGAVAYTYNEPTLQAEYILAAAPLLRENSVASAMVTNGAFSPEVRDELALWVDAMNIDIKTFDRDVYGRLAGNKQANALETVMRNVEVLAGAGVHIELTNLIVPGVSDSERDFVGMVGWISSISPEIPLHISRYFPAYRYTKPPAEVALMKKFQALAEKKLKFVHLGNVW